MSGELRLKKLRGSGGYVMASVTDDQQRKGNLGGPDLFLAPVGRIDADKISKYFCNACEKDYEGSPKIDYENPNELVADNLMLLERGQYICTTCGSVLAEYREFSKPNETADVGLAKPQADSPQPHSPPPPPPAETPRVTQVHSPPQPPAETLRTTPTYSQPEILPSEVTTFNSIIGVPVYDYDARKIGIVKQVGIQLGQPGVVLIVTKKDGKDIAIKWDEIKKINEIVLVGEQGIKTSSKCNGCGFENKPDSKFCESCGKKLK
ncbi:MAG: PRC-barrel domain-containing protein [Nitrosopumilaceae archaeon]